MDDFQIHNFTVFPAIDLRAGKVVRLSQGDPRRLTIYADDPLMWAERWKNEGAEWLHVINLDGAFGEDNHRNMLALKSLLEIGLKLELGGGIRQRKSLSIAIDLGIERVFLGTAVVENPALVDWALATYGDSYIAADIGSVDGKVAIQGWQKITAISVLSLGRQLFAKGIRWCVLTDILRDGVGRGINVEEAGALQMATGLQVVASGGIRNIADVKLARQAGLAGLIIGRALYEGTVSLKDCFQRKNRTAA